MSAAAAAGESTLTFSGDALYMEEVYSELGGSVIVEHCVDCHKHASTTRHDEKKYQQYFEALYMLVGRCFPYCECEANPPGVLKRITGSNRPRLGTFEVFVANEDGTNKQVVFSKQLTNKWPHLPTIGRYIMNVIDPEKIKEYTTTMQADTDGMFTSQMPTMPFIYNHGPVATAPEPIQQKCWGFGNANQTTHAMTYDIKHQMPLGPELPQMTHKEAIWADYNALQRTARPPPPRMGDTTATNTNNGSLPFDTAEYEAVQPLDPIDESATHSSAAGDPVAEAPPAPPSDEPSAEAQQPPPAEAVEADKPEGLLPPVPDAEPAPPKEETAATAEGEAEGEADGEEPKAEETAGEGEEAPAAEGEAPAAEEEAEGEEAEESEAAEEAEAEVEAKKAEAEGEEAEESEAAEEAEAEVEAKKAEAEAKPEEPAAE